MPKHLKWQILTIYDYVLVHRNSYNFILTIALWAKYYYYLYFLEEETEAQSGYAALPKSHSC